MLIINSRKFAENNQEFINTLFEQGNTAIGFYKIRARGRRIDLFDIQKVLFASVINNKANAKFIVSSRLLDTGKNWYSCAMNDKDKKILGFDNARYLVEIESAKKVFADLNK
jgi:hypothetical protein